jgi:micrococcal nuclease
MTTADLYHYKAKLLKVVDGDTVRLEIDLGFTIRWVSNCRLHGINTPELNSTDLALRARALEARQYVIDTLPTEVLVKSVRLDKYGRPLVEIYFGEGWFRCLNKELLDKQLASTFI